MVQRGLQGRAVVKLGWPGCHLHRGAKRDKRKRKRKEKKKRKGLLEETGEVAQMMKAAEIPRAGLE